MRRNRSQAESVWFHPLMDNIIPTNRYSIPFVGLSDRSISRARLGRWNTRELVSKRNMTTTKLQVRVRLWMTLKQLVPQNMIPTQLQLQDNQPSSAHDYEAPEEHVTRQELQRNGPNVPTPGSRMYMASSDGNREMTPATFYVDLFNNVISPSAVRGTLTYASVAHVFPYSRGGLSTQPNQKLRGEEGLDSNLMLVQHDSNCIIGSNLLQKFVK